MKTKLLYLTVVLGMILSFSSCNLDYFPSDELNGNVLMNDEAGAEYILDGCYAMLKEEYEYVEYASSNTYVRHFLQCAEFPSDNICLSGRTTDPLYQATCYKMTSDLKNVALPWWIGYKVIYTANTLIEGFKEGEGVGTDQILGEAYFLRAMVHFNLVSLFGKPYVINNGDNPGIPLRTSTNTSETTRATVAEVYTQVIADLQKAAELMTKPRHAGNGGYATKNTALGLLSRVYLYMGENQKVLDVINEMGDPASNLDPDYANYFKKAVTSKETLLCIAHTTLENRGSGSIGSMYNDDPADKGWGEVYPSDPLLNLYERYPQDVRYTAYIYPQYAASNTTVVYFSGVESTSGEGFGFHSNLTAEVKADATGRYCEIDGTKYRIDSAMVNGLGQEDAAGEYKQYFVTYGGEKFSARIVKAMMQRNTFPMYFSTKFSYQDGMPQLSSPVFLRWGEVLLNRAEAHAKLGHNAEALADVNAIRTRAGIPTEGLFEYGTKMHGYTDVLDIVLDERRMELAFEGHRMFDVYRNQRNMDRRYGGVQPWEVIEYTDNKIQFPIPVYETSVSGIQQNPGY